MPELEQWHDFFVAEAGASAALAGLVFVAVSINLARILEHPQLPRRVGEALLALASVLVVSTLGLVPARSPFSFGWAVLVTGLVTQLVQTVILVRTLRPARAPATRLLLRVALNQFPAAAFVVAGAMVVAGHPTGLYWVVPGTLLSFAAGILGAWVLLIEIQR